MPVKNFSDREATWLRSNFDNVEYQNLKSNSQAATYARHFADQFITTWGVPPEVREGVAVDSDTLRKERKAVSIEPFHSYGR
jgi:hypothetical protein